MTPEQADPPDTSVRMTSPMLKALSHPLRRRILELMGSQEPRRAADLARVLHEPANSVSFHLRQLAAAGLIVEAPEHARDKRDRVWVAAAGSYSIPGPERPVAPADEFVLRSFIDQERIDLYDLVSRILAWAPEWSSGRDERQRAEVGTALLELTDDEARALAVDLTEVVTRARERSQSRSEEQRSLWRVVHMMADDSLPPAQQPEE